VCLQLYVPITMSAFAQFVRESRNLAPRVAIVLGSGLDSVTHEFREAASVGFGEVPGLVPPTVHGHTGRLTVGLWRDTPAILFLGRLHFYEGHSPEVVTDTIRVAADLGIKRLILTNAAGGIHPSLVPGSLMAIRGQFKLIGGDAWRSLAHSRGLTIPYSTRLLALMPELFAGVYAGVTGPSYETPAEIRALKICGAHAVGMSTAMEAEQATELGLELAGISCIANMAAGLGSGALAHADVLVGAKLAIERLAEVLGRLVRAP
jgi:purine-nucleoside phosphorylase